MDPVQAFTTWKELLTAGGDVAWWQQFYVYFYQAFIESDRWKGYLEGVGVTLIATALALLMGVILGVTVAVVRTAHDQQRPGQRNILLGAFNAICRVYVTIIRGTPMMVQVLIFCWIIFGNAPITFNFYAAMIAFGINSGAYVAEIVRAGINAVNIGQTEAGRSLGLTGGMTMRYIVLPQAIKNILPALANEAITLLKETAIVGYAAQQDITYVATLIRSRTYSPVPLLFIALVYLILVLLMTYGTRKLERRLARSDRS